jgi:hypothetical protein
MHFNYNIVSSPTRVFLVAITASQCANASHNNPQLVPANNSNNNNNNNNNNKV